MVDLEEGLRARSLSLVDKEVELLFMEDSIWAKFSYFF